jgi:hypothetical protein
MIELLKRFYETLNSTEAAVATATFLAAAIPIVLKVAALLKLDTKKLPRWAQPIPGFVLALAGALLEQLQGGSTIWDSLLVLALGFLGGTGLYHTAKRWTPGTGSTAAAALLLLIALPATTGCAGSLEEAKLAGLNPQARVATPAPSARCQSLDNQHRVWGAVGKGAAVLAGAEGISTWPVQNQSAETALAIGAGVTAAVAATAEYLSEDASATWARECVVP